MKKYFFLFLLLPFSFPAYSQSGKLIDEVLSQEKPDIGTAATLALASSGHIEIEKDGAAAAAADFIRQGGWYKKGFDGSRPLTAGDASYLIMRSFNVRGGLLYSLIPGPRYAVREMKHLKLLDISTEKGQAMTGEEFLVLLSGFLAWRDERL